MMRSRRAVLALLGTTSILMGQLMGQVSPPPAMTASTGPAKVFQKYCFECHGASKPKGQLNLERLVSSPSIGQHADTWDKIAEALETSEMPPADAEELPTVAERAAAAAWVRSSLQAYAKAHAGEPGRVTVRRLTSGEYAYAIRDLTGIDLKVPIDASSDSVGGEGFTNFGDVQFVQDASIERYLEAAKQVADHAVIGAGPLQFFADPGKTGLELSALSRINELYATKGFRFVSGEGGRPFGLERYGKAFFVAWYFQHRKTLREPDVTLRELAAREGITGRFADHIWAVVNEPALGYPSREMIDRWKALPPPTSDAKASLERARAGCDELYKFVTSWPSWFFARGDLAAGGRGDESPLVFDDKSLQATPTHAYTYPLGSRFGRFRGPLSAPPPEPTAARTPSATKVQLSFANLNPTAGVHPVVIWRNARIVTRAAVAGARGGGPAGRGRGPSGPILSSESLRNVLPPEVVAKLAFGRSPDGSAMAPEDFATTGPVDFEIAVAPANNVTAELQVEAELGADRNGVVRLTISDPSETNSRGGFTRVILGDPASDGYRTFRAGMAQFAALLPPNSHGEANPADKDPVPAPFDNTYNSPEHDAFVLKVKYQRTDAFFTANLVDGAERTQLNHAWHDLFGSWPYHNAYLDLLAEHYKADLQGRRIQDMSTAAIASLPEPMRPHVTALRAHHEEVRQAQRHAEPGHLQDALTFATRAWRRPLTEAEETRLRDFYRRARADQLDHDDALRALLARILVSPAFLYRVETVADSAEQTLNGWELASRLSFFLWSSIPDEELLRAAGAGELREPAQVARQVKRMTADPKARRLATEFFGQWLGFYRFDEFRGVDTSRFPEFTDAVKSAMHEEAIATFEYLVRHQRPVREIVDADYTFLNQPLAKFYGIEPEVKLGEQVTKIEGAQAFDRGGVLRLGSVLTTTSAPLRTSPVKRGDWLLRRILGTPTPPPPADAGSLPSDPQAFGGLTLRARLNEHKRNPTCANCHLRIDPLGFPLEGFDAVGRSRKTYPDGTDVDVIGEFADKSTIVGAKGLLSYLHSKETQIVKNLSRKLLGYALGRTVLASDRALIDEMVAAGGNATIADLATKIVLSRQFRHRQGHDDTPAPNSLSSDASNSAIRSSQ